MAKDYSKDIALSAAAVIMLEQIRNMLHENKSINAAMIEYMETVLIEAKDREIEKQLKLTKGYINDEICN